MPPPKLIHLDPAKVATTIAEAIYQRTRSTVERLGLVLALPSAVPPAVSNKTVIGSSVVAKTARVCAEWAVFGLGRPADAAKALAELRTDLALDVGVRPRDLDSLPAVIVVAVEARLAIVDGRAIDAVELAILASIDDRTVRAAVQAGHLRPVGPTRPMRFAPEDARAFLFARGVRGISNPAAPAPPASPPRPTA